MVGTREQAGLGKEALRVLLSRSGTSIAETLLSKEVQDASIS